MKNSLLLFIIELILLTNTGCDKETVIGTPNSSNTTPTPTPTLNNAPR